MQVKRLNRNFTLLDGNIPIAHKGIYGYTKDNKKYIKPNTFLSCKIAIDNNIPFECDIRNTLDNIPVLAHENIINIKGRNIKISKHTYSELIRCTWKRGTCKIRRHTCI